MTSGPSPRLPASTSTPSCIASTTSSCAGHKSSAVGREPVGVPFGVYVHVPFCARRCDYCAFATWTDRHHLFDAYTAACRREIDSAELPAATSVFFGGGTPSLLPAALLCSILAVIPREGDAEVTVECNPESVSAETLASYRGAGVNRLSLGVQSTVPRVLASLGRTHSPGDVGSAVAAARDTGFTNFNVDLIF